MSTGTRKADLCLESCTAQVKDVVYDLRVLKAPRLGGLALRMFTWLAESWIFRLILAPKLMRDSGLPQARASGFRAVMCWAGLRCAVLCHAVQGAAVFF